MEQDLCNGGVSVRLSVCLSVLSIDCGSSERRVCCWVPCWQKISISSSCCWASQRSDAVSVTFTAAVGGWQQSCCEVVGGGLCCVQSTNVSFVDAMSTDATPAAFRRVLRYVILSLWDVNVKVNRPYCTRERRRGAHLPVYRPWASRWIDHWSLWRMASATPDLRLPSQPQSITAPWPVPNYTCWWQRNMCVNNLPKVVTWKWNGRESNPRPFVSRANTLTITPPGHRETQGILCNFKE